MDEWFNEIIIACNNGIMDEWMDEWLVDAGMNKWVDGRRNKWINKLWMIEVDGRTADEWTYV